jgi:hypothetical protein
MDTRSWIDAGGRPTIGCQQGISEREFVRESREETMDAVKR